MMKSPHFASEEEEAAFWDTTDTSELLKSGKRVSVRWSRPPTCPFCGFAKRRRRFVDVDVCDGRVTLHGIEVHYCPSCKRTTLPQDTHTRLRDVARRVSTSAFAEIQAALRVA
jgi:ribosomal protein L37AE/L43A